MQKGQIEILAKLSWFFGILPRPWGLLGAIDQTIALNRNILQLNFMSDHYIEKSKKI